MVEIISPFPEYALPRVFGWLAKVRNRVADDFGPRTVDDWVDQELNGKTCQTWGVYRDGELGGMISFQKLSPWLGTAHCTFRKDFWGRATTRPAVESALREMFGSGIGKLTFLVFADNQAIRSLLSEFGATVEGTFKGHTLRDGKPTDMKSLGLAKETFDGIGKSPTPVPLQHGNVGSGKRDLGKRGGAHVDQHPDVLPGDAGSTEATA